MSRRRAREVAMQALFQLEINPPETDSQQEEIAETALTAAWSEGESLPEFDRGFARGLVGGVRAHRAEIDEAIAVHSHDWKIERMSGIDRNILRIAIYEMKFGVQEVTPGIVINEAVELAKKFGTDDSSRFVNGILGAMVEA